MCKLAHQRDHDVRKILADALMGLQRIVDRRIDARGVRRVVEIFVDRGIDFLQQRQRIAAPLELKFVAQAEKHFRWLRVVARKQHFPIIAVRDQFIEFAPGALLDVFDVEARKHVDGGFGDDFDGIVLAGNVEVVHGVAIEIAETETVAAGLTSMEEVRQRCRVSLRGCRRTSMTLSPTAGW